MRDYTVYVSSGAKLGASPWTLVQRLRMQLWGAGWALLCSWTPKPLNWWRLALLRVFGAKIHGRPFVHQRARIQIPWNLILENGACIGDRANLYSLGQIHIGENAVIAQEAYLCTGSHDFTNLALTLISAPIQIGSDAFVGARAFIMPGVTISPLALIGACAVVTKNVEAGAILAGNPAVVIGHRPNPVGQKFKS